MSIHERTLDVIGTFYNAAMDETLWRASLERLCNLTGSQAASSGCWTAPNNPASQPSSVSILI
jgi:hypothetical protein